MRRVIRDLVIHCSATPNHQWVTREQLDEMHVARGFHRGDDARKKFNPGLKAIGYHYVVYRNGGVETGRHEDEIGAHVQGSNARSIGICLIGTDLYTPEQWEALQDLVVELEDRYPGVGVYGHRDYSPDLNGDGIIESWEWMKTCPGFDVRTWRLAGMEPLAAHMLTDRRPV